eukprot:747317-Hanusia_phi.AAC.1
MSSEVGAVLLSSSRANQNQSVCGGVVSKCYIAYSASMSCQPRGRTNTRIKDQGGGAGSRGGGGRRERRSRSLSVLEDGHYPPRPFPISRPYPCRDFLAIDATSGGERRGEKEEGGRGRGRRERGEEDQWEDGEGRSCESQSELEDAVFSQLHQMQTTAWCWQRDVAPCADNA